MTMALVCERNLIVVGCLEDLIARFGSLIFSDKTISYDVICVYENTSIDCDKIRGKLGLKTITELNLNSSMESVELLNRIVYNLPDMSCFQNVYTYSVKDDSLNNRVIAAAVGKNRKKMYIIADGGIVDRQVRCTKNDFEIIIELINKYAMEYFVNENLKVSEIRNTILLKAVDGFKQYRYFLSCVAWKKNSFSCGSPWEFQTSLYENKRHELEISVLMGIQWSSIIEVGACEGAFTKKLIKFFPNKKILALEPDEFFYKKLKLLNRGGVKTIKQDCKYVKELTADVLFVSNVLYYCESVPKEIFEAHVKYIIVSHDLRYHKRVLDYEFKKRNFRLVNEKNLGACLESTEEVLCIKYGANIKVWERIYE